MKFVLVAFVGLLALTTVHAEFRDAAFELGPQRFRTGDRIEIEEVESTNARFREGVTVRVSGNYELASRPRAAISLYVTAEDEVDARSTVDPAQCQVIEAGVGEFELEIVMPCDGYLHVSFYPAEGGTAFGGVYFGKSRQMKAIENWTLDWYLEDTLTPGVVDQAPSVP